MVVLRSQGIEIAFDILLICWVNVDCVRDELKEIFDEQVNGIFELIDTQLRYLQQGHPREQVVSDKSLGNYSLRN